MDSEQRCGLSLAAGLFSSQKSIQRTSGGISPGTYGYDLIFPADIIGFYLRYPFESKENGGLFYQIGFK